jgi:geranylgeranyl diphosphate synthase type II
MKNKTVDIHSFLHSARKSIDHELQRLLAEAEDLPYSPLFTAARYSLLSPGKRLRPLIVLAVCESYGTLQDSALVPACALEMIHTYSLIHDDLPCMDDDDLRRGKPTLHKVYPEWHALLTGDFLLTYPFELLSCAPDIGDKQKLALIHCLSKNAGAHGMIGGQMIDLLSGGQSIDWTLLEQMHLGKTSGLMIAALEFGGILSRVPPDDLHALRKAGSAIGLAFQLADDLHDHAQNKKSKTTAVTLLGIEGTRAKAEILLETAKENLNALSCSSLLLNELFDEMIDF